MAFRIVVADIPACYQTIGVVHGAWPMVPERFKDYISTPKSNNYRSLHTTVIGPEQKRIEIQVRTREMHEVAEIGVAAHWLYKGHGKDSDAKEYRWLRELLEILEQAEDPEEFLEHTKLNMFQDQVFCFTPKGDLIALPRGSTPVDMAYAIHSDIGDTTVGSKVNGRIVPLRSQLQNGDQVEILRSKNATPSPAWEGFVVTGKARSHVRRFIRTRQRSQYVQLGKSILEKRFRERGHRLTEKALTGVLGVLKAKSIDDIYAAAGEATLGAEQVLEAVFPNERTEERRGAPRTGGAAAKKAPKGEGAIPIRGLIPGMALHFGGCCHPLPGDRIVGIVTTGRGVTVHTIDCDALEQVVNMPERWLDVMWENDPDATQTHVGRVITVVTNEPGALSQLSTVIAKYEGNISNLKITNRSPEFFEMMIDIEVRDVKHLTNIIAGLRACPVISSVERSRG
jgi:GTP pyrophosphokinase